MYGEAAWSIKNLEYVTNIDRCLQESLWEVECSGGVAAPTDTAHPTPTAFLEPAGPTAEPDTARRAVP